MKSKKPSIPYLLWMLIFTIIPILIVLYFSFTNSKGNFTLDNFINASDYSEIFLYSLMIALISTAICLILGYPISYLISTVDQKKQGTLIMFIMVPMWMNFLLRIYSWVLLLQNYGPFDMILRTFGIHVSLIGNSGAVIVGMVYEFLPFMILPLHASISKIDSSLFEAARDLGCSPFRVFVKVLLPLSLPGIISGFTMVFVPTASTFLVAQYLGGTQFMIGDVIERVFQSDRYTGSAIAVVLMIVIFGTLLLMNRFGDEEAIS